MKKGLIYLLIPLCVTFLPACSKSYTLTLVNSDTEAGTILTEGGKFKAGEEVHIEVEPVQGYKVDNWTDSVSGKIGTRAEFNFVMPNRDTELTVYYIYDDFELTFKDNVTATGDYYDLSNFLNQEYHYLTTFYIDNNWQYSERKFEYTWKDRIELNQISDESTPLKDYVTYDGVYDENGTKLGDKECSFDMPNHDAQLEFRYTSKCYCARISSAYRFSGHYEFPLTINGERTTMYTTYYDDEERGITEYFILDNPTVTISISMQMIGPNYVFDYWLDLDTNEVITTEESFTVNSYKGIHNYFAVMHMNEE